MKYLYTYRLLNNELRPLISSQDTWAGHRLSAVTDLCADDRRTLHGVLTAVNCLCFFAIAHQMSGLVICTNKHCLCQGEEHPDYSKACVRAHNGAVISLQRSPFFEDIMLSVGDWSCALWKEGQHQAPLFTSPHAPAPYTAGCWSPTRPGHYLLLLHISFHSETQECFSMWSLSKYLPL